MEHLGRSDPRADCAASPGRSRRKLRCSNRAGSLSEPTAVVRKRIVADRALDGGDEQGGVAVVESCEGVAEADGGACDSWKMRRSPPYLHQWRPAAKLKKGEHLKTSNGQSAVADGGSTPTDQDDWMWDLTIQDDHDFYVLPTEDGVGGYYHVCGDGVTAVLVHNCNETFPTRTAAKAAPYERAGITPGTSPDATWAVGNDVTQQGMPGYRYDPNPGAQGNYEQFETEDGSRVVAEHTNDPEAPYPHFHAGQPKVVPSREGVNLGRIIRQNLRRYAKIGGKCRRYYQ
jgi:hypothetical protein